MQLFPVKLENCGFALISVIHRITKRNNIITDLIIFPNLNSKNSRLKSNELFSVFNNYNMSAMIQISGDKHIIHYIQATIY